MLYDSGHYCIDGILKYDAKYYMIYGQRSSGKTTDAIRYCLQQYIEKGAQFAYVRRWDTDIRGKNAKRIFNGEYETNFIKKMTNDEFNELYYENGCYYLAKVDYDTMTRVKDPNPCAFVFALNNMEHDKSTSYPGVKYVIFDEFLARDRYLIDEFVIFCNVLSTIIRRRNDVKIFMLGNTVNKYCPYFKEMGLKNAKNMKPGDIEIYKYGDSELTVVVEHTGVSEQEVPSDVYFAFDNPKLSMITSGEWELDIYPHCPMKYRPKDIKYTYFIEFDEELLQCEIIKKDKCVFTFIHRKTTPLQNPDKDMIFTQRYDPRKNWRRIINRPIDELQKLIWSQFRSESVYYQDNEVGNVVMNYLYWCDDQY